MATSIAARVAKRQEILENVIHFAKKHLAANQLVLVTTFIRQYFSNVPLDDLASRSTADLYGAVLSHWHLIYQRKPKECKVQVFNPDLTQHGWESTHTIVEIIQLDMPFLVDSMRMELTRLGYSTHLVIHLGGMQVRRNDEFEVTAVFPFESRAESVLVEAPIYMEIDRETDPEKLCDIRESILRVLQDVRLAVRDWQLMQERVADAISDLSQTTLPLNAADVTEAKAFLHWLVDDHFTFLGYRDYKLVTKGRQKSLQLVPDSGLGVLRDERGSKILRNLSDLPTEARKRALSKDILIISKTNTKSTVHRPVYTDYIGVKLFDKKGHIIGERRFIGLFTSDSYNDHPQDIPFFRRKVDLILKKSGVLHHGHAAKALLNILETYPRDDLFQGSVEELAETALGIWHLQERRRIRLFLRRDAYNRYVSCLVYLPRDSFNTDLLNKIQKVLCHACQGEEVAYTTYFPESILARVHYVIRTDPKVKCSLNVKKIEDQLVEVGRSWKDSFLSELYHHYGEEGCKALIQRYVKAFPAGYRDIFPATTAVYDVAHIESLHDDDDLAMSFYRPTSAKNIELRFKLYRFGQTIPLSDAMPLLENLGLRVVREQPYEIQVDGRSLWINDFHMEFPQDKPLDVKAIKDKFQDAFYNVWRGDAESDGFNQLVLAAQLSWRQITVFRAYAKYLRQVGFTFSQQYMHKTFAHNPELAKMVMDYFYLRFDPKVNTKDRSQLVEKLHKKIHRQLGKVSSLDEDRIIRRYVTLIDATLRTNYFQLTADKKTKTYLSLKIDSSMLPDMPLPIPKFEIFVYSPRFEGVHLRSFEVARGGLRHSDRREDFRTEILGLVKAQQVKNAVIVPSGAKGGFVTKVLPADAPRELAMLEVIDCYRKFISGLLDVVDNLRGSKVIKPKNTVCYDNDDLYLVVAADKGTATFSDIANAVAAEYDFWLGDAFASGGSVGYDHKKMGITARGAWESVKVHFQEMGRNPHKETFTAIGIGDMSGDVFGNGMIMSEYTKLVAAFNHNHIFIDPNPDPKKSYIERIRLFHVPRSSWLDYSSELISRGGGVYSRAAKSIKLSPQAKTLLGLNKDVAVPNEIIQAILKADVDLLWNGGIGTYVKATSETDEQVGDRANDGLRINGRHLGAKIVAEGGNLGLTQLARIEFDRHGGAINTDFIDNSGGVDCSDREVNIKILLGKLVDSESMTLKERNALLVEMTDAVAKLVLTNNYRQARAISFAKKHSLEYFELYRQFINNEESRGRLPRAMEFLPDDTAMHKRKAKMQGLTRPELSVLMAYSRIILKGQILASTLPEDPCLYPYIAMAFPEKLREKFEEPLKEHRLRRELIATQLSNEVVTHMGITFVYQLMDETNEPADNVVRAYVAVRRIFDMPSYIQAIEALDYQVSTETQMALTFDLTQLIRRSTRWFLRNRKGKFDIKRNKSVFTEAATEISSAMSKLLVGTEKEYYEARARELIKLKIPKQTAEKFASLRALYSVLNIAAAARSQNVDNIMVAELYFNLMNQLDLNWFREQINAYPINNHWAIKARAAFKGDLDALQRALTISVLDLKLSSKKVDTRIDTWLEQRSELINRWYKMLGDLRGTNTNELAMLTVAMRELNNLAAGIANKAG